MNKLQLPEVFGQKWDNMLILTYGAELPFFENTLWRQFGSGCPNKIILMDGKQYLSACENYLARGMVRFLNQRYIVDGIYIPQAAHAKVILLSSPEKGCLIVGSGNLGHSGYASGGELFTRYDYDKKTKDHLPAFLGVWNFIQELESKGYINQVVQPYIKHMFQETPWLFHSSSDDWDPIRHNLNKDLMTQFVEQINNEQVIELWVMSPFYDEDCQALQELLQRLSPQKAFLLVQPGRTSVDAVSLSKVLSKYPGQCGIYPFRIKEDQDQTYIHAKLYLAKTKTRSVCLQGSPNLSRAAMMLCPPYGNIELANLLLGKPDSFDHLLEDLEISTEPASPFTLDLTFDKPEEDAPIAQAEWYITGANWIGEELHVRYHGRLPEVSSACLCIGNAEFLVTPEKIGEQYIRIKLTEEVRLALLSSSPISISFDQANQLPSNPISVCNIAALNKYMLEGEGSSGEIEGIGALDLDDEDFVRLLGELDSALVYDHQSIWRMTGKTSSYSENEDEETVYINYSDIDYEQLKHHPKLQAYYTRGQAITPGYPRSRLQGVLASINSHFDDLVERALFKDPSKAFQNLLLPNEVDEYGTEEEKEADEQEKQKRRWSNRTRLKVILRNFIRRYIRGVKSPEFQEIAGYEVMSRNYVIFTHILWRLLVNDQKWIEPEFIVESLQTIWNLFWGSKKAPGYFTNLGADQHQQVIQLVREHHNDGLILAAIFCFNKMGLQDNWEGLENRRIAWRDFLRHVLSHRSFPVDKRVLEDAWIFAHDLFSQSSPSGITATLLSLSMYETQITFLRALEDEHGLPEGSCTFIRQNVWREHLGKSGPVECFVINNPNAVMDLAVAKAILGKWQKFQQKDYYRITTMDGKYIFFFDIKANKGLFYNKETEEEEHVSDLPSVFLAEWEVEIQRLVILSKTIDIQLTMNVSVS